MSQTEALEKAAGMRISAGFDGLLATLIWAFDSVTKEAVVEMRRMRAQSEAILAAVVGPEIRGEKGCVSEVQGEEVECDFELCLSCLLYYQITTNTVKRNTVARDCISLKCR
jgi:hypothetical protein